MEGKITDKIVLVENQSIELRKVSKSIEVTAKILAEFTSRELNNSYKSVKIGNQEWMVENLNVSHFRNGDPIFESKTKEEWKNAGDNEIPAWCHYNNDPELGEKYGKLYNWFVVNDKRGIDLKGWHVPTNSEWEILTNFLDKTGKKDSNIIQANIYNEDQILLNTIQHCIFSGLPGGYCDKDGIFYFINNFNFWWTASEFDQCNAHNLYFRKGWSSFVQYRYDKRCGFIIRCIRD